MSADWLLVLLVKTHPIWIFFLPRSSYWHYDCCFVCISVKALCQVLNLPQNKIINAVIQFKGNWRLYADVAASHNPSKNKAWTYIKHLSNPCCYILGSRCEGRWAAEHPQLPPNHARGRLLRRWASQRWPVGMSSADGSITQRRCSSSSHHLMGQSQGAIPIPVVRSSIFS